jgi:hypothetical protein
MPSAVSARTASIDMPIIDSALDNEYKNAGVSCAVMRMCVSPSSPTLTSTLTG